MPIAINTATISGHLIQDPEKRDLGGPVVARMTVASCKTFTKRNGSPGEDTVFVDIDAYGKNAENCAAMLHKGDHIVACGRLAQDVWTGEDGRVYSRLYIKADTILFPQPSRPA